MLFDNETIVKPIYREDDVKAEKRPECGGRVTRLPLVVSVQ